MAELTGEGRSTVVGPATYQSRLADKNWWRALQSAMWLRIIDRKGERPDPLAIMMSSR